MLNGWGDIVLVGPGGVSATPPGGDEGDYSEVLSIGTEAARVRTADELSALIAKAKGALTVSANSSLLIVALNNSLRFGVTKTATGNYEITDRGNAILLAGVGVAALLLILMVSKR